MFIRAGAPKNKNRLCGCPHPAGFAIRSPRGISEPHDSAPRGSQHPSYVPICIPARGPLGGPPTPSHPLGSDPGAGAHPDPGIVRIMKTILAAAPFLALGVPPAISQQATEPIRQAVMKSDLRNLVTAEEAYFADSVKYTADLKT